MRSQLRAISAEEISAASRNICELIANSEQLLKGVLTIAVYSAYGAEVSLADLHRLLPEKQLVYPLCHAKGRLTFHHVRNGTELSPGMLGILEPDPDLHPKVPLSEIHLLLCPGLAFGLDGSRLGHGGGYYDRALEHFEGKVCGVALDDQVRSTVPHNIHDIGMDYLIREADIKVTKLR